MKCTSEIRSLLKNNLYYLQKIEEAVNSQLKEDLKLNNVNVNVCSTRFRCLDHIICACQTMRTYSLGIESNLSTAEEQDKYLLKPDIEIQEQEQDGGFRINDGLGSTVADAKQFYEQQEQPKQSESGTRPGSDGMEIHRGSEDS